jgi:sigma-B regulation protein RsbU (phosphoserine phosphatase)
LDPGDCILQFTDGLNEMRNAAGEEYGIERLKEVLVAEAGGGALYIVNELRRSLDAFRGAAPQSDDLTIVVVKAMPAGVARTRLERNKAADGVLSR